ncbi:MAG: cobyrinate a,c-diamide synthase [Firmicutes bacterium]|nr:cobyrinate a,c-diamide synthase [Bacillota bacterium]
MNTRDQQISMPRLIIAALGSGAGKTTVTMALLRAWSQRGLRVQPFKVGPDYIDPHFHEALVGVPSWNLDAWMDTAEGVQETFSTAAQSCDVSVIEGVMGLFDGVGHGLHHASTAHVARLLNAPVLLVLDVHAMAESAAALVMGVQRWADDILLGGVVLNRVGSPGHYALVREAIESATGVPVLGYLPSSDHIQVPERQLGLTRLEPRVIQAYADRLLDLVNATLDFGGIYEVALKAPSGPVTPKRNPGEAPRARRTTVPQVALALDEAFWFYYPANLALMTNLGAKIIPFSPIRGEPIPREATHLYWGGGFPEEYLEVLARHGAALAGYRARIGDGLVTLAECGGWMMMAEEIRDVKGQPFPMIGVAPVSMRMTPKLSAIGYREVTAVSETAVFQEGTGFRGHEFHYSTVEAAAALHPAYQLTTPRGHSYDGYCTPTLVAGYVHLYFPSNPMAIERWLWGGQKR